MNVLGKILRRFLVPFYVTLALATSTGANLAQADDTDIYVNNTPAPTSAPMVMFMLDYRPNLGSTICGDAYDPGCTVGQYFLADPVTEPWVPQGRTFVYFDVLRLALHKVLSNVTGVKVGFMMSHDSANSCAGPTAGNCSNGGYILKGFEQLDTQADLDAFTTKLFALPTPQGNVSHTYQGKEMYFEFFRYLTGQGIYNAHNGWTDFGTNSQENLDTEFPEAAWDSSIEFNGDYISPLRQADACVKIFAINFLFQVSQQEDDSDAAIEESKANGGMAGIARGADFPTAISWMNDIDLSDGVFGVKHGGDANEDGIIDSKYDLDGDGLIDPEYDLAGMQNVTSYFISEKDTKTVKEYAQAGGTNNPLPLTGNPEDLIDTLTDIFNEILSVSTTFVAASVPVNVFNRAESLDNVFIALFQAKETPFWTGNLKKLKLSVNTGSDGSESVVLADVTGQPAIASQDGRIKFDALTYWTNKDALPAPTPDTEEVAGADGRVVDRGAAGQKIPGYITSTLGLANGVASEEPPKEGPRKVLYETVEGMALQPLNADTTTATDVKAYFGADVTEADAIDYITWLRGINPGTDTRRDWILGDPLHSRPLPINYGTRDGHSEDNPLIYIAMASNDGYMHFFRNTDSAGNEVGKEVWAFVPTDIMDTIPRLVTNDAGEPKHPYTVDGAPSVYLDAGQDGTISEDESAFLYFGLRRGGRTYYALDISDPNQPKLAWEISNETPGFEELGYTWSRPQIGQVDYDGDAEDDPVPVVIFAGGYDPNKDRRGVAVTDAELNDKMGRAIYVVHAETGDLIWKATYGTTEGGSGDTYTHPGMLDSIPSDVTAVDTNNDEEIDRILVGDTGGKVWRIDTFGDRENWQATVLANLGRHFQADTTNDRRFFHRPDFVQAQRKIESNILNPDGTTTTITSIEKFDAVLIGSGDRPNPLDKGYDGNEPMNWLYMIRDTRILPAASSPSAIEDQDGYTHAALGDITDPDSGAPTPQGWKLKLGVNTGEKSLSTPLTLSNTVYFTTYLPTGFPEDEGEAGFTCGPSEGAGLLYAVDLINGDAALNYNSTDDNEADGGTESASDRYKELSSAGIPADVVSITVDGRAYVLPPDLSPDDVDAATRWRTFWYEVEDSDL